LLTPSLTSAASAAPTETILLIGHGTRDREGADEFRGFANDLAARLGGQRSVLPCFLELAPPSILGGIEQCVARNAGPIIAVPLFLFGANHVKTDVPAAFNAARARHPGIEIRFGAPFGVAPELLEVLDERIAELEAPLPPLPREETAVLLVERGSSDPDANAAVFQVARLVWEGRGFGWVETCFIGITRPDLDEGLTRCVTLGARRVLVVPYFLFTGVLVRRIQRVVQTRRERHPLVELAVGRHLGRHPRLVDLAVRRLTEIDQGEVRMSCDRCKYRLPLVGFENQVGQPQHSDHNHGLRTDGHAAHEHGPHDHGHDHGEHQHG
jgi:sirohydrochlorin cobaltochelatase